MKKRLGFLVMLVAILAFGLVSVGCKSDGGGGGLSVGSINLNDIGFVAATIYGSDPIPPSPVDETEGDAAFTPVATVLEAKYKLLEAFIANYVGNHIWASMLSGSLTVNDTIKITDIIKSTSVASNGKTFTANGIFNLAGTVKIVATVDKSLNYNQTTTITLSSEYDSDDETPSSSYSGERLYAKSKINLSNTETGNEIGGWDTRKENATISYAVAYADTDYCGLAAANFSYKWNSKHSPSSSTVDSASGNIVFSGLDKKQTFKYTMSKEEVEDLFDL